MHATDAVSYTHLSFLPFFPFKKHALKHIYQSASYEKVQDVYKRQIFLTAASRRSLDRVSVPMWPVTLSGRLLIVALVGRYPTN